MRIQMAMVSIMRKLLKGKDDDDYDNDVNIDRQPTQQAYGLQSSNYNNYNYNIINNYNNYIIMKLILTGHQPSKHMVCRAPGRFVYPSSHSPYFLWNWKIYPASKYHPHQHHHHHIFFGFGKYIELRDIIINCIDKMRGV